MKLSQKTIDIIKSFSTINNSIWLNPGNVLSTMSSKRNVLAQAVIDESFPSEFGMYDINQVISIIGINSADVEFEDDNLVISKTFKSSFDEDGNAAVAKTNYRGAHKVMFVLPPENGISFPETEINMTITEEIIDFIFKTSSVIRAPNLMIESDGTSVYISICDAANVTHVANSSAASSHSSRIKFARGNGDVYKLFFKIETLNLYPGEYELSLSITEGISMWKNKSQDITYWILIESGSTYQKA